MWIVKRVSENFSETGGADLFSGRAGITENTNITLYFALTLDALFILYWQISQGAARSAKH
jgi:hypothetical protein